MARRVELTLLRHLAFVSWLRAYEVTGKNGAGTGWGDAERRLVRMGSRGQEKSAGVESMQEIDKNEEALEAKNARAQQEAASKGDASRGRSGDASQRALRFFARVENRQNDRLVSAMRPLALLLALFTLNEMAGGAPQAGQSAVLFLYGYLAVSVAVLLVELLPGVAKLTFPAEIDLVALAVFIALTPSLASFWFFYLFAVFAMATRTRQNGISAHRLRLGSLLTSDAGMVSGGAAIACVLRTVWLAPTLSTSAASAAGMRWIGIAAGTYLAGLCVAWLGMRERAVASEDRFIERLLGMVRVEKGLAESVRLVLSELAREFECQQAVLAIYDEEVERLFTWKGDQDRRHVMAPEVLPLTKAGAYLAEDFSQAVCWNSLDGGAKGFGWERDTGKTMNLETPPMTVREELSARSVMAVTMLSGGHPSGRMLVVNGRRRFGRGDLQRLERAVRQLNVPLENVFQLRHLRTRAVEAERSRISRDLHDGILQTLLSLNIQLGVLERKAPQAPEAAAQDIAALRTTVKQEGEDLRQMVKDLRPLRVESADLREMMYGFAERYHNESGLVVDLFLEENDLRAPDRICREVFQIYRESLNNIKKHAHASHVVVKLWQDDTKVFLVVDDNGQGFSFSGKFGSEELDRLRLGPISIKERTRTVGGVLTVESNPGHGARLTIEIPVT
jgi:signal transduction histidine kinase